MNTDDPRIVDSFGRRFGYVRLSVTEICNFRCVYCLPNGYRTCGDEDFLSPDEILRLVRALTGLGVHKIRLTGGEPTTRADLTDIIARIARVAGVSKLALTTNGWNLRRDAAAWVGAGLTHLNVSVDSLEPARFAALTGQDRLSGILAGIDHALSLPFAAVKLNAVLMRETLAEGFDAWASFVRERDVTVRFIELMRTGDNREFFHHHHVSGDRLREWLDGAGWTPRLRGADDGPAVEFGHPDHRGRLGLIAPYGPGFCDGCNRLRITARGRLRLCLFAGMGADSPDSPDLVDGCDLRDLLRPAAGFTTGDSFDAGLSDAGLSDEGPDDEVFGRDQTDALHARILDAMRFKRAGHGLHAGDPGNLVNLSRTGG